MNKKSCLGGQDQRRVFTLTKGSGAVPHMCIQDSVLFNIHISDPEELTDSILSKYANDNVWVKEQPMLLRAVLPPKRTWHTITRTLWNSSRTNSIPCTGKRHLWLPYKLELAAGEESSPEKPLGVAASSKLIMSHQCVPQQSAKGILIRINSSTGSGMRDFLFTQHLLDIT